MVGDDGTGEFIHSGGTCTVVDQLRIAQSYGSEGTYTLSGTGELSTDSTHIGLVSTALGEFIQTGGRHEVADYLYVGFGPGSAYAATYELQGGALEANVTRVPIRGSGTFNAYSAVSTLRVNTLTGFGDDPDFGGHLQVGHAGGSGSGSYSLGPGQSLDCIDQTFGYDAVGTLTQTGGANTPFFLYLGGATGGDGRYMLSDAGYLDTSHQYVGDSATGDGNYELTAGELICRDERVGNYGVGRVEHSGGQNTCGEYLALGFNPGGNGTYELSGTGRLAADYEVIGRSGTGLFTQLGGSNTVATYISLGQLSSGDGTYTISGGTLDIATGSISIGSSGAGTLNVSGSGVVSTETINVYANGTLSIAGGSVAAETVTRNTGATVSFTGGRLAALDFTGSLVNPGGTLAPGLSPDRLDISGDYTQGAGATLEIELAGKFAGQFDRLYVTGTMDLGGELKVVLIDGYTPAEGDQVKIINWGTLTGQFQVHNLPELAEGLMWDTSALYTSGRIEVVPEPVTPEPDGMVIQVR